MVLDESCAWRSWLRIPPLAVGFGIYLPMDATAPVVLGALIGWLYNRSAKDERAERLGVLVASGMIVGESLFGVINAGLIVGFNHDAPLAVVVRAFQPHAGIGSLALLSA